MELNTRSPEHMFTFTNTAMRTSVRKKVPYIIYIKYRARQFQNICSVFEQVKRTYVRLSI